MNIQDYIRAAATTDVNQLGQIDEICDAFEDAWARGLDPQIEDYLTRCDDAARVRLFSELLLADRELRIRYGKPVAREDYHSRFPDYSTVIDGLEFATIDERSARPACVNGNGAVLVAGQEIARFELLEEIGAGASGIVWKARDTRLRRIVALKISRHDSLTSMDRARFVREGQACAQLRHPNIVAIYEAGEDRGRAYIAAELIEGINLRDWLPKHRPTPREAAELAAQLAEALHYAHGQDIVHRDLKPANVLIDRSGRPLLTDFGLAKWTATSTVMTVDGDILGTPAYMSPEQARGETAQVDGRTDVYGLGALLYELLTGRPPFSGDLAAVVHQVIHDEPPRPREVARAVPRDLETICLRAMDKVANRRYPSAQELAVDLQRFSRGDPILSRRAGPLTKSWRWLRRRPAVAAAIVLPLLVLAIAVGVVKSVTNENYRQQGFQRVQIVSNPPGARIAIVPIDKRTGEPNAHLGSIIRPSGVTPLTLDLKPDYYLVEAVIFNDDGTLDFAEVYRTLSPPELVRSSEVKRNTYDGRLERVRDDEFEIEIRPTAEVIAGMVAVPIGHEQRREHPMLPEVLYVDHTETTPSELARSLDLAQTNANGKKYVNLDTAVKAAETRHKRLASAAEYDAIGKVLAERQSNDVASSDAITVKDLFGGLPEWTTTKYEYPFSPQTSEASTNLRAMRILKGYGDLGDVPGLLRFLDDVVLALPDSDSPEIGFRGVRSSAPRFATP